MISDSGSSTKAREFNGLAQLWPDWGSRFPLRTPLSPRSSGPCGTTRNDHTPHGMTVLVLSLSGGGPVRFSGRLPCVVGQ